jgi:hypothetical protein
MRNSGKAPTIVIWRVCLALYIIALVAQLHLVAIPAQVGSACWMVGFGLLLVACRIRGL